MPDNKPFKSHEDFERPTCKLCPKKLITKISKEKGICGMCEKKEREYKTYLKGVERLIWGDIRDNKMKQREERRK